MAAMEVIEERLHRGVRPREWDSALVCSASEIVGDAVEDVRAQRLAYLHALDAGHISAAKAALNQVLIELPRLRSQLHASMSHEPASRPHTWLPQLIGIRRPLVP
jgi:hypothetical protein